jgi:hypothetical protein
MTAYKVLDLSSIAQWRNYLQRLPVRWRDIYFTPEYYQLYEELNDGRARCFIFERDGDLALCPLLVNSVNCLKYTLDKEYHDVQGAYGYNGILSSTQDREFMNDFHKTYTSFCRKHNIIAEFTRFHPLLKNEEYSREFVTLIKDRETVAIDLTKDYLKIWETEYSSKNRNMIRKAIKRGYTIEVLNSPKDKDLDTFMDIYYNSMKNVTADSYYFFKKEYFINIFKYMPGHAFLFNVVDPECGIVCASIFFKYGDYFHYHLSGRKSNTDNSVNNFLIDRALDFARDNGAKFFHLGGGRTSNPDDSLLKFKKNFAKHTLIFYIGKKIHNQPVYDRVVQQWKLKYPEKIEKYDGHVLKYRY